VETGKAQEKMKTETLKAYINPGAMDLNNPEVQGRGFVLTTTAKLRNGQVIKLDLEAKAKLW
jgi:hypothetical protein